MQSRNHSKSHLKLTARSQTSSPSRAKAPSCAVSVDAGRCGSHRLAGPVGRAAAIASVGAYGARESADWRRSRRQAARRALRLRADESTCLRLGSLNCVSRGNKLLLLRLKVRGELIKPKK